MVFKASDPIGVFDSGLGGLTILNALQEFIPNEHFIYFGDTAHLPYGEKSEEALISYVQDITAFLYSQNCKMVVVACNSASTVLNKTLDLPYLPEQVLGVISPIVDLIGTQKNYQNIGVIGTKKTILSGLFERELKKKNPALSIISREAPLLVPMIEEGFSDQKALFPVFERYFKGFEDVELLIPACTHYPMIYRQIEQYFNNKLKVLHTPKIIAEHVIKYLQVNNLENDQSRGNDQYYLSDLTDGFRREAEMYLGKSIDIKKTLLK